MTETNNDDIVDTMGNEQKSRWLALFEAINIIADKADSLHINFEKIPIKSTAISKYVREYSKDIYKNIKQEK